MAERVYHAIQHVAFFCQQLVSTTAFESYQTSKTFKIYHKINCKRSFVIYLQTAIFAIFSALVYRKHNSAFNGHGFNY